MYTCPYCASTFNNPFIKGYPKGVVWYKYQSVKPVCPSCGQFLEDCWQAKRNRSEIVISLILIISPQFFIPSPYSYYSITLVLLYSLMRDLIAYRKGKKVGPRYVKIG